MAESKRVTPHIPPRKIEHKIEHSSSSSNTAEDLNQERCIVYEYSNNDGPRIQRIDKTCIFELDQKTIVRVQKDCVTITDGSKNVWIAPFDTAQVVGCGCAVDYHANKRENPDWVAWSTKRMKDRRIILVILRKWSTPMYTDNYKLIRDGLDLQLVPRGDEPIREWPVI